MMSVLSTRLKMAAVAALVALLGAALHLMDAAAQDRSQNQDRSPVFDVATANAEMAAAIARARATLPAFWASYEAPKASEAGHSLKVRFATRKNDGEHIWMAEVKKLAQRPLFRTLRQPAARFAGQARRRPGRVQRGRHLGLDVHAQRQDRRRRDHQAAAEVHAEG